MEFNEYQTRTMDTAIYREKIKPGGWLNYTGLKLAGEAGEFAQHIGKSMRDDDSKITERRRLALANELGDVLWYVAQAADLLGFNLNSIAAMNIKKLEARQSNGTLQGSGDNR